MFSEIERPVVNGVVASIAASRAGLQRDGIDVVTFAPFAGESPDDIARFASLPLPTSTGYRLCLPYLRARDRARLRAIDVAHAHSPFVSGWFALAHARRAKIPLVYTYHTRFEEYAHYGPFGRTLTRAAMIALTRAFANRADAVVVPTRAMERRLRELGVRARVDVVPSAIDVDRFRGGRRSDGVRALLGARDGDVLLLAVARLAREKNLELAIDALALLDARVRLAIIGEGTHRRALVARARRRGVAGRVRFAGALAPAALPDVYASAEALLFTSTTDTQGLVLAEAQAAGLPVFAVDSAVARDVLAGAGRLVAAEPRAVAAAVAALHARPPRLDPLVAERYGLAAHARELRAVYRSAAAARRDHSAAHLAL